MKCENILYSSWWKLLLVLFVIGNTACSSDKYVYEAYTKIFDRVLDSDCEKSSGAMAGRLSGKANFFYSLKNKTITVKYGFIPLDNYIQNLLLENYEWYKEVGSLSSLTVEDDCGLQSEKDYFPVSIQGRWTPEGTGSGHLVIAVSKGNELEVYIFGEGNWKYWSSYKLSPADARYVLDVMNEALAKSQGGKRLSFDGQNEGDTIDWLDGAWTATNTPIGNAIIIIKENTITEIIDGVTRKGRITIGDDYLQVSYDEGSGVRLDLDRNNKRIGLGEGWWLSKENKGAADGNSYHISSGLDAVSPSVQNVQSDSMDYRFLSERLLTEFDLQGLSKNDIRLMRNAIFARHGYIFKNKDLADYFSSMDWYEPRYSDVTSMLTEIELKNIEFLKKHE